jgi:secondary thiamine-phosphate synthase enzyme
LEEQAITRQATRRPDGEITVLAQHATPPIRTEALHLATTASNEFWDLTEHVRDVVNRCGVRHGQVTVYTPHTTTSIVINESETGFLNDYRRVISQVVPDDAYYEHDDHEVRTENLQEDEFLNGHSHVRQLLVGQPSVTVPVVEGEVILGQWQRVLFVELDQPRERRVFIHAQGI